MEHRLVDAHCHMDLYPFPEEIVAEADREGIATIAVTNAPFVFEHTAALASKSGFVFPALGLHPQLVSTHGHQIDQMLEMLGRTRFVGEIGLDYGTTDPHERKSQREIFESILARCAEAGDKVLTVHSRRAASDVIEAVGDNYPGTVILHWFSGKSKELERAMSYGMHFSVNTAMMRSKNGRTLVRTIPRERVLTETDGPFVKMGADSAKPSDVASVVADLANMWSVPERDAERIVAENFQNILVRD